LITLYIVPLLVQSLYLIEEKTGEGEIHNCDELEMPERQRTLSERAIPEQIPLESGARDKMAFTVPGRALYQFTVMPVGLRQG